MHQLRPSFLVLLGTFLLLLQGCSLAIPKGIKPVNNFQITKYAGVWYEIARLDNRFERGLEQVTATYRFNKDGSIQVKNEGTRIKTNQRKAAIGKAKPVQDPTIGHLKVSFFGPFYSSYIVFYVEPDYSVALVCTSTRNQCWILARNPQLSPEQLAKYQQILKANGFAVECLLFPKPYQKR